MIESRHDNFFLIVFEEFINYEDGKNAIEKQDEARTEKKSDCRLGTARKIY
jgi:hypothetical protein